ncbi:hypothetical protein EJB05_54466 [Eragrostis curvula]|uniref:Uncharacterized protein n=1 Tax=Eragrostis curvula TaxID=38414 RepID=A0A5J9SMH0_9POAL|nr:hypothetical protein EJB05_54466 [Eragrostis curvula]
MAKTSRGSEGKAIVQYQDRIVDDDAPKYRFQVLLPNGLSIKLALNPAEEMPVHDFLVRVKKELSNARISGAGCPREINWGDSIYLTDLLDNKIKKKIKFSNFDTKSSNILRLHDGMVETVSTFENMWDLTPQTDLLQELPAEYSTESALVDLIDNALQALWSNDVKERKLIRISVDKEKIVIFDTGRGMDGSDGNSISKWGTMGSSNHRAFRDKGIGGRAPYLLPFFGLFGYGGTIASMHLGRMAIVSSKTKESRKVFTLHLSREALLEKRSSVNSKTSWKTAGSVRDPTEEEILLSPHQSFTQVEISGLKRHLEQDKLHGFLKDIYFPYIQYDEDNKSMNTRNPVEFEVNGLNLAEIQEGEVTVTNLHSSNGPDFILQLKISQTTSASCQAHARLKCVYFPIIKGKESINVILEKLRNDGYETKEDFDNFSRVSVRRLGRLLPDARWGPLPFMEPKYRKGQKAEFFKRCCKRVKCFVETDAGFYPTLSKNDLAQHNPFTKALRCLGSSYIDNSSAGEVHVDVCDKNGKLLSNNQLEKQYYDWIKKMHEKYDVEMDGGNDEPTFIINPGCNERLGLSKNVEVIRAHTSISRKGKTWKRGDRLKILSGAFGQMKSKFCSMKNNFYGTLEYIVVEGLEEDVCGEASLICRPMDCADSQGCILDESEGYLKISLQESVSFPVSIIDDKKCEIIDNDFWNQTIKRRKEKAPALIEVIRNLEGNALGIGGDIPFGDTVVAGYQPPDDIVAVMRPGNFTTCSTSLEQKYIVKDDELEMEMKILTRSENCPAELIDKRVKKPSLHNGLNGLYIFPLREASRIFTRSGVYVFSFSVRCRDSSIIRHETTITVEPDLNSRSCQIFSVADRSVNNTPVDIRIGWPVRCLSVISIDMHGNRIPFVGTSSVIITILHGDDVIAHVDGAQVQLSSDSSTLNIMEFLVNTNKLDVLRPGYEAQLKISSYDNEFSAICPCKVKPGHPSTIKMDFSLCSEESLIPGRVIDNALLEVFDHCGNHVEEGIELNVHVDGFSFLDKLNSIRKVNGEGFINLCGALTVVGRFGSQACMTVSHHEKKIFSNIFQIAMRELKAVDVPECCPAGSVLENIIFVVSDSDGLVDVSIDGPLHTLKIISDGLPLLEGAQYAIEHGKCVVSHVQLPNKPGIVTIVACHTHYPDLETTIQLELSAVDLALMSLADVPEPISFVANSDLFLPSPPSHIVTYVQGVVEKTSNEIQDTCSKIGSTEKNLKTLYSHEMGPKVGSFIDAKELIRLKIMETMGSAAYVLCSNEHFMHDIIGTVALLGTVADNKIGRMLATYLGKDDMLAVVCTTLDAAKCIENYKPNGTVDIGFGIHHEAAALGAPIKRRFPIICLDAIEPYKGDLLRNSPQKELALALPFPDSKQPKGYKGFAVNMINLSVENLNISTRSGHGLRETLFYSLFGELQVYETRNDMLQAMPYLRGGAISLDGGVIKGNGKLLLGYGEPKITFPVVAPSPDTLDVSGAPQDIVDKIRQIDAKKKLLAKMEKIITIKEKDHQELLEKHKKKKRKFDQISDVIHPCSALIDQCTPDQEPEKRTLVQTPQKFICKQEHDDMDMGASSSC